MNSLVKATIVLTVLFLISAIVWFAFYSNQNMLPLTANANSSLGVFQTKTINPVLMKLDLYSRSASNLLLGTAIQESFAGKLSTNEFQIENATAEDVVKNFLPAHPSLQKIVDNLYDAKHTMTWNLNNNVDFEIAMARIIYLRTKIALPNASNVTGMGEVWKKYYNTVLGKGTVDEFKMHYISFITQANDLSQGGNENNSTANIQNVTQYIDDAFGSQQTPQQNPLHMYFLESD